MGEKRTFSSSAVFGFLQITSGTNSRVTSRTNSRVTSHTSNPKMGRKGRRRVKEERLVSFLVVEDGTGR